MGRKGYSMGGRAGGFAGRPSFHSQVQSARVGSSSGGGNSVGTKVVNTPAPTETSARYHSNTDGSRAKD